MSDIPEKAVEAAAYDNALSLLNEAFNALGNLIFDIPGKADFNLQERIGKFLASDMQENVDPAPPGWEGRDWIARNVTIDECASLARHEAGRMCNCGERIARALANLKRAPAEKEAEG